MSDLFGEPPGVDDFALPGDESFMRPPEEVAAALPETQGTEDVPLVEQQQAAPEGEAAEADAGRERNELGQFVARTAAEEAAETEPDGEALILGKYRTAEEAIAAHGQVEQELGRLRDEVGQRRQNEQALADRLAEIERQQQQPVQQPTPAVDLTRVRDFFDENPAQIPSMLVQAHEAGHDDVVAVAIRAWEATGDDAGAENARLWVAEQRAVRAIRNENLARDNASNEQMTAAREVGRDFLNANPDVDPDAMQQALRDHPELNSLLQSPDKNSIRGALAALKTLATTAARPQAATLTDTAREIAREQALAGDQAIRDAHVVSAGNSNNAAPLTRAEEIAKEWDAIEAPLAANSENGWNIS